jgi:hypothetical protein
MPQPFCDFIASKRFRDICIFASLAVMAISIWGTQEGSASASAIQKRLPGCFDEKKIGVRGSNITDCLSEKCPSPCEAYAFYSNQVFVGILGAVVCGFFAAILLVFRRVIPGSSNSEPSGP